MEDAQVLNPPAEPRCQDSYSMNNSCGREEQSSCSSSEDWDRVEDEQETARDTLYARLGIDVNASSSRIRSSYLRLARKWHPDRHKGDEAAKARFQAIAEAFEVLSDESLREKYDRIIIDRFAVEDYLERYQGFILTVSGLGLASRTSSECWESTECLLLTDE